MRNNTDDGRRWRARALKQGDFDESNAHVRNMYVHTVR